MTSKEKEKETSEKMKEGRKNRVEEKRLPYQRKTKIFTDDEER